MKNIIITIIAILAATMFTCSASAEYLTTSEAVRLIEKNYNHSHIWTHEDGEFNVSYEGLRGLAYIFRVDHFRAHSINEVNNRYWFEINTITHEILDVTDEFAVSNDTFTTFLAMDYPEAAEEIREVYGDYQITDKIRFKRVMSGEYSNAENRDVVVVRDMNTLKNLTGDYAEATLNSAIDFRSEMALVFQAGICPSGGYDIDIQSIRKKGDDLFIKWDVKRPEGVAMSVMTSPYVVVAVPSADEIYFERL